MKSLVSGLLVGSLVSVVIFAQTLALAITAPVGTVSGLVPISAQATATGLTSVQFHLNGAPFGAPILAGACTASLDTRALLNGGHTLRVSGVTTTGATVTSPDRAFTVNNPVTPPPPPQDTTPPVVEITAPATSVQPGLHVVRATASDNVGLVGVRFSANGVLLEDDTTISNFDADWTAVAGTHTLTAVARDGAGNTATATRVVQVGPVTPPPPPPPATFVVGDRVEVTTTTVNVRATGGGTLLGTQPLGATGTVVGGPTVSNDTTWWQIDYATGVDGWSGEGQLRKRTAPPPVACLGSFVDPIVTTSACVAPGTQTVTTTRTYRITRPASDGGAACPFVDGFVETVGVPQSCTFVPPFPLPIVSMTPSACTLKITSATSPDKTSGWGVQYRRNGVNHGSRDTSAPFERSATVTAGSYVLTAIWTKTGQPAQTQALGTKVCP